MALRVLMVGAHPDDIEIAAAGTAARLVDNGAQLLAVIASDETDPTIASVRRSETQAGLSELGLDNIEFLGLPDRAVEASDGAPRLLGLMQRARFEPDVVITHTQHDNHPDHRGVATMVHAVVGERTPILAMAVVNSLRPSFRPTFFVDTTEFRAAKWAALAAHQSQDALGRIRLGAITGLEAEWAQRTGGISAEAFEYSLGTEPTAPIRALLAPCRSIAEHLRTESPVRAGT